MYSSRNGFSYKSKSLKKLSLYKIALYQRNYLSKNLPETPCITKNESIKKKFIPLEEVFKNPKNKLSSEKNWPKITRPKLPFSIRNTESNEYRKNQIRLQKPSKTVHDFQTVKWLRNKYSDSVVEKSVLSLLPEKSNEVHMIYKDDKEKNRRYHKMMDYLKSFKGPVGREKFVEINPKYLFNESTFDKILKLREIFLEFDQRKTQKMEFDEILNMFNQNHIKADKNDIADLFFKGRKIKRKEDIAKLNIGFFQFIRFALKKEQNFKEFMRKIKEKNKNNEDKENVYLPMDFNLIMDYFINKEKERHSINKLKNQVEILNNDIIINQNDENINFNENDKPIISLKKILKKNKNNKKEKKLLSDINILELYNEFINLFNFISKSEIKKGYNSFYNYGTTKNPNKTMYQKKLYNSFNKTKQIKKCKNSLEKEKDENYILNVLIKNQINKDSIKNLKLQNYYKYHDINLAREETLTQIKKDAIFNDSVNQFNLSAIYLYKLLS